METPTKKRTPQKKDLEVEDELGHRDESRPLTAREEVVDILSYAIVRLVLVGKVVARPRAVQDEAEAH